MNSKGIVRKKFMESGQPLANWRGRPTRIQSKKRVANKQACRKYRYND